MSYSIEPIIVTFLILLCATCLGIHPIKKLITINEAHHELKRGSAGYLRSISGWVFIAVWIFATWLCATIMGEWWVTGDINGALENGFKRLELILTILSVFAND